MRGCFFFTDTATTEIYTLSLHDARPIWSGGGSGWLDLVLDLVWRRVRSAESTSELELEHSLVCRLLLEKNYGQ